ncbi:MAG TPA: HAMP domain-containing sensor histidine kinase [Candidatus Saccharimonadales bacterium]|nr:HAMP domain-containing sensor histidine kinase [Candidatus Saccharimonadales bacterium]
MEGEGRSADYQGLSELPSVIAAAHELKSPLILMRQLSLELGETRDPARAEVLNQRLRFSLDQSLRLVEQLSLAPRLEDGIFGCEPVETQAVCVQLVDQLGPLAKHLSVNLDFNPKRQPLVALANRDLLPALLVNLCDNALSYTPAGGRVEITAARHGSGVRLSVRDQGPSISRSAYRQLKHHLGKSAQPLGARPRSSGLGLWIAGRYAEAMSAKLSLVKHRGQGLTFAVDLPKSEQLSLL